MKNFPFLTTKCGQAFFLASLLFLSSCVTARFAMKRMAPAKYDIVGIKRVGLMNFSSEDPAYTNGALAITNVIENKLNENGFLEVAPRVNRHEGLPIQTSPVILPDFLAEVGRKAGVDALIFGLVNVYDADTVREAKKIEETVSTGKYRTEAYYENGVRKTRQVEIKEKKIRYEPYAKRQAAISYRAYVLLSANAKYIGKETLEDGRVVEAQGSGRISAMPSEQYMLSELTDELAERFVASITPHEVTEYVKLKGDKTCNAGLKLAKKGDWDGAIESWDEALQKDPNNHLALYDMGVAYEYRGDYQKAREYYRDALKFSNKSLYNEAWVRVHDIIGQNEKLEGQLKDRKL